MALDEYRRKRKFDRTPEPNGRVHRRRGMSFVVQKHRASRLHYDLRLEMEGVLRSWAIPRGPSLNPGEKRLAVQTEDHPLEYGEFEGVIPKGNYGAGNVIVWDRGAYEMVDPPTPKEAWTKRKFHIRLHGDKLRGEWVLVETRSEDRQWIFFKVDDGWATDDPKADITEDRPESVVSGLLVDQIGTEEALSTRRWDAEIERELVRLGVKRGAQAAFPRNLSPMLATSKTAPFDDDEWLFEIKFDGVRAIAYRRETSIDLRSRNQKSLVGRFPEIAGDLLRIRGDEAVIDGEIVAMDADGRSRFHLIQPRIHLASEAEVASAVIDIPVVYQVFDLLYVNGYGLTRFPLETRKTILRHILPESGRIRYADHVVGEGRAFFDAARALGLEGVVAKRRDSPYRSRRSKDWVKIKASRTEEFVIAGYTLPSGTRPYFGALVLGLRGARDRLVYVGRVGSGFDDRQLEEIFGDLALRRRDLSPFDETPEEASGAQWVEPELVCSVRFNEWTREGRLRAPVFVSMRDDVEAAECVLREEPGDDVVPSSESIPDLEGGDMELTNLDKVFWPPDDVNESGLTKGDLLHFYREVAEFLNPHLEDRLLVLKRYPDGITGEHFYQKDAPGHTSDWVPTAEEWSEESKRWVRYFVGGRTDTLLYLANLGAISVNPWHSRLGHLDRPDYAIFDLDPGKGVEFDAVRRVALELKKVLDDLELRAYPKTSGATGIHVYLPLLEDTFSYQEVRVFTEAIASIVVSRVPDLATAERTVRKRPVAVYVDCLQNVRGKTVASVYSVRARPGAPVSTPLRWSELQRRFEPTRFHMKNLFRRLGRTGDLFGPVLTDRQDISAFLGALSSN